MGTREILYSMIDGLSEQQMQGLIMLLSNGDIQMKKNKKSARGIFSDCANPDLIPLEEGAWERTVAETYEDS